jgi:hypothetical protein
MNSLRGKDLGGLSPRFRQPEKKFKNFSKTPCINLDFGLLWLKLRAFLSSSVVERSTVNRLVAGSNPAWGVNIKQESRELKK